MSVLFSWYHPFPGSSETCLFLLHHWCFLFCLHVKCPCWSRFHPSGLVLLAVRESLSAWTTCSHVFIYHADECGSQLCSCSPHFSLQLQTSTATYLLDNSIWCLTGTFSLTCPHLNSAFSTKIPFFFWFFIGSPTIQPVTLARNWAWILTPFLQVSTSHNLHILPLFFQNNFWLRRHCAILTAIAPFPSLTTLCRDYWRNLLNGTPASSPSHCLTRPSFHNFAHCVPLPRLPSFVLFTWFTPAHPFKLSVVLPPGGLTILPRSSHDTSITSPSLNSHNALCCFLHLPVSPIRLWALWGHFVLFIFVDLALSMSLGT